MSIFLSILEYLGIIVILLGSIGLVHEILDTFKDRHYDYNLFPPFIIISIGIALVYFT